jgi:hypothetical protein
VFGGGLGFGASDFSLDRCHFVASGITFFSALAAVGLWPVANGVVVRWPLISRTWEVILERFLGMSAGWFVVLLFGVTFGITNLVSLAVFEHVSHIQDNVDQLFHE